MKYTTKTAIEIMTEDDRSEVIPFFEHHFPNCNRDSIKWEDGDVFIGWIWSINEFGNLGVTSDKNDLSDYTILKGVPQNWREDINDKSVHREVAEVYQGLFNLLSKEYGLTLTISEMDEIVMESAKVSESENKELRQVIKNIISCTSETFAESIVVNYHSGDEFTFYMTQAKQLLEK